MALQTYTFSQIVSNVATAMQAASQKPLNFKAGAVLLAIAQATAGVVIWLQAIIMQLLTLTRASTSRGADLDSFMADFDFTRLAAKSATGLVTFSRFTPTLQALIPAGAKVQTSDGTQQFSVIIDTTNSAWNPSLNGYVLAAMASSLSVSVQAVTPGTAANVQAASITVLSTAIPGVDTVSNGAAFINGIDAEADPAFRSRFRLYLASLSKGTNAAVEYSVASVQQGLADTVTENEDFDGTSHPGYFYVVIDDFTGSPGSDLINAVKAAIEDVRGLTINFDVIPPNVVTANIAMTLTTAAGYDHSTLVAQVSAALTNFINAIPLGSGLPYTQIASVAYGVAGVLNASSILLNGGTADIAANKKNKVLAGTMTVA